MLPIILFAIIGAKIHAGTAYWICFGFYCLFKVIYIAGKLAEES